MRQVFVSQICGKAKTLVCSERTSHNDWFHATYVHMHVRNLNAHKHALASVSQSGNHSPTVSMPVFPYGARVHTHTHTHTAYVSVRRVIRWKVTCSRTWLGRKFRLPWKRQEVSAWVPSSGSAVSSGNESAKSHRPSKVWSVVSFSQFLLRASSLFLESFLLLLPLMSARLWIV